MNMKLPFVSIVISTFNRASSLRSYSCPAIAKLTYPKYEIIVVDDGSTDDTQNFLKTCEDKTENFHFLRNDRNRGASFSRNRGVDHAKGDIIVFIDDDVSPFPDCLDELVKVYTEAPDVMVIWGCIYQYNGSGSQGTPTFGTGSLWSMRRAVFDRFRFDTNLRYFQTPACDEHELARRIQKQGLKIIKCEKVQANHFHAPAENRKYRGLGGDLNHLYEKLKSGSISEYYACFILGFPLALKRLLTKGEFDKRIRQHRYKSVLYTPYRLLVFIKQGQFSIAAKWLFYILIDIPLRAKTKTLLEKRCV
ncbi:MAG TPA: glycosyltransferase family 2 protein [Cyanobacteria bacterium UBA11162]|nr:glycosyltransferase family 2 protein [Cyanobacteria bacterium UBA11162]